MYERTSTGEGEEIQDYESVNWNRWSIRFFIFLAIALGIAGVGLGAWAVNQINNNIITEIEILEASTKRDDPEWTEELERAVLSGGVVLQKVGQKLKVTTSNVGLSLQRLATRSASDMFLALNTGTISIEEGTNSGMDITSTPVARDIDDRVLTTSGTRYTIKTTAVQRLAVATAKRGVVNEGLVIGGDSEETTIQNTGIITFTPETGLINTGDDQNPIVKIENPFIFVTVTISRTDLASGASKTLYTASSGTATYRIVSLASVATGSTNFSGGDRIINIGTSGVQKWFISATAAATTGTTSLVMSTTNAGIQASTSSDAITDTVAGANIVAKYSGGTTDYTAGAVVLSMIMIQTAY